MTRPPLGRDRARRRLPAWALLAAALGAAALGAAAPALAQQGAGGAADAGRVWASCAEHVPKGATRPQLTETFPKYGFSGYAAPLEVTVTHGKGETVLPEGFKLQRSSDAARALEEAGFVIPEADAGSGPTSETTVTEDGATTRLVIPFVPLPKDPGRNGMLLPPVPIAVSRASGELVTVCTAPHPILVEDPIANERDPKVRPNPPARPQREDWALARQLSIGVLVGAALGLLIAWLVRRWLRRPKIVPPPPPRLPWVVALEELRQIRRSDLLKEGRTDAYFDAVSDCIRKYLGARYGFDGLESTSDEMRALLKRVRPQVPVLPQIAEFLGECDLVKFARVQPTESGCLDALALGESIVHRTTPPAQRDDAPPPAPREARAREGAADEPPSGAADEPPSEGAADEPRSGEGAP